MNKFTVNNNLQLNDNIFNKNILFHPTPLTTLSPIITTIIKSMF